MLAPPECPLSYPDYFKELQLPLLLSPKYDGVRCITRGTPIRAMSRTWKPLPSQQVQEDFIDFPGFDGELIEGIPTDFGVYNRTQSHVMSFGKPGDLRYFVFDTTHPDHIHKPFYERLEIAHKAVEFLNPRYVPVRHVDVEHIDDLLAYEEEQLKLGFEGIMCRNPVGHYKQGRGTFKEGLIYKLKRFEDDEGVVLDIYEQMTNNNVKTTDERGYAKRSDHKDNKTPSGMAGGFIVGFDLNGHAIELEVAPGAFTHAQRKEIWENKDRHIGNTLKFRFMRHGMKDKPRFSRALGWRTKEDM